MNERRGFSLIEVIVAMTVLGIAITALIGLLSGSLYNLGRIQDVHRYHLAGEEIMNRVLLLPSLPPGGNFQGELSRLGARWSVSVTPWIPQSLESRPADAIMKIDLELTWQGRSGERNMRLETVKPAAIAYSDYDFNRAVEAILPEANQ